PLDRRNQVAIGYDMFTEPVRREAMERARDTGQPSASARVVLIQEIDSQKQQGFLIYTPLYALDPAPTTVEGRRAALTGFVYSPFRTGDLLAAILSERGDRPVAVRVYDGNSTSKDAQIFDSSADSA